MAIIVWSAGVRYMDPNHLTYKIMISYELPLKRSPKKPDFKI